MEKESFYAYLKGEQKLTDESLYPLKQITEKYPYFQTAKLMLLKNMQDAQHTEFAEQLKKDAITCCDRRRLFYYLNNDRYARFFPHMFSEEVATDNRTEALLDSFLKLLDADEETNQNANDVPTNNWDTSSIISTDYIAYLDQDNQGENNATEGNQSKPMKHQELVDKFLEKSSNDEDLFSNNNRGRNEPQRTSKNADNLLDDDSFLTETLAQVYIKQKKYEQALTIIKRLSLNFPKKSIYFADQIRFLEYLIYNDKNKK